MNPTANLLLPELIELLEKRRFRDLRESLRGLDHRDVADLLAELDPPQAALAFRILPSDEMADVFSYFDPEVQEQIINELGEERAWRVLEDMNPDDLAALFDDLPSEVARAMMERLSPETRRHTQLIMGYPLESVGRLMSPEYVRIRPEWTVAKALENIRRYGHDAETLNWVFVIDAKHRLADELHIRKLLLADPETKVAELLDGRFIALRVDDDQEEAVRKLNDYDRSALPVIDANGVLLGIVTFDDVADIAEEEATEDFHKLGGMRKLDTAYSSTGIGALFRKRAPWLVALVGINLMSSGVIAAFEEVLEAAIMLAFFLPLLIDSGGNVGSQAATLMVRSLATGDVLLRQWFRVVRKELFVGVCLGLAMGVASAALGLFRGNWEIGLIVGLSMVSIVLVANIVGTLLPFILSKIRIDPAVASAPLITTVADTLGLLIYFSIASAILTGLDAETVEVAANIGEACVAAVAGQ
ncbi:MAG: magnesium transporter [Phycisphaerales bacterium]|nr:MAG: magnesium transporter [Phycisphaerales bacterium]